MSHTSSEGSLNRGEQKEGLHERLLTRDGSVVRDPSIHGNTGDWGGAVDTTEKANKTNGTLENSEDDNSEDEGEDEEDEEDEALDTVSLFIKHHRKPTGMTGNKRMDRRLRADMGRDTLWELGSSEELNCSITVRSGTLGIAVNRSSHPQFSMQVDYLTGKGNVELLREAGVTPLMVIKAVNGKDMSGVSYEEVRDSIKPHRAQTTLTLHSTRTALTQHSHSTHTALTQPSTYPPIH
jgi:hypothetical protein